MRFARRHGVCAGAHGVTPGRVSRRGGMSHIPGVLMPITHNAWRPGFSRVVSTK